MNNKIKTCIISLCVVFLITLLKFLFYWISGSIAVYSEAWHSFSDIATSLIVLISVLRFKQHSNFAEKSDKKQIGTKIDSELMVSFSIGLLLLYVSISIIWNLFGTTEQYKIYKPVLTGSVFIILSFFSFFLYKFQASVADATKSVAIKADSMHSKADMIISILTGFSLIIYSFGFDIDKPVSILIAILIFTFALEMLVNTIVITVKKQNQYRSIYSVKSIVFFIFNKKYYITFYEWIVDTLKIPLDVKTSSLNKFFIKYAKIVWKYGICVSLLIVVIYLFSLSVYTVDADKEAFRLVFGKVINQKELIKPGLHFKWPWPIEKTFQFSTKRLYTKYLCNKAAPNKALIWAREHGDNKAFISGDDNFFLPYIGVVYRIKNPYDFYFIQKNPEQLLENICGGVVNQIFVKNNFYDLALFNRSNWIKFAHKKIQQKLNELSSGIFIEDFFVIDFHPPSNIATSFEAVVAAHQACKQFINNAYKYVEKLLPKERSIALKTKYIAQSDKISKMKKAEGEAQNYLLKLSGYRDNKIVAKKYMILETAEKVLTNRDIILVDPKTNLPEQLIYIERFLKNKK